MQQQLLPPRSDEKGATGAPAASSAANNERGQNN